MRSASSIIVFTAAALALVAPPGAGFARSGIAHHGIVPGTGTNRPALTPDSGASHKLLSSTIDYGDPGVMVQPYAFPVIDSATVHCPKATCTVVVDVTEEVGGQTTVDNYWAACGEVDGFTAPNGCPYNGILPTDGSYISGSARQTFSVTHGAHTVGFELFVESAPAVSAIFDAHYEVLSP